jgi:hypothetical protein
MTDYSASARTNRSLERSKCKDLAIDLVVRPRKAENVMMTTVIRKYSEKRETRNEMNGRCE